jgi:hypothetical protein
MTISGNNGISIEHPEFGGAVGKCRPGYRSYSGIAVIAGSFALISSKVMLFKMRSGFQFNSQFCSVQFNSIQFNSIQFNSISSAQFSSVQFNLIQRYNPIRHCIKKQAWVTGSLAVTPTLAYRHCHFSSVSRA